MSMPPVEDDEERDEDFDENFEEQIDRTPVIGVEEDGNE